MKHVVLLKSKAQQQGGLEKAASRIANAFVEKGARLSLLTTGPEQQKATNISIIPFQTVRWPSFIRMEQYDRQVQEWIRHEKPDLVFGMDRNRFQTHFRAGNGVHISYLKSRVLTEGKWKYYSCMINPMHRKILEMEKAALENPKLKKVIANSYMVRDQILEHYNLDEKKIVVIHNGVEWQELQRSYNERDKKIAEQFGLHPETFHFLFIGNGYLRKGLKVLLEAISQIRQKDFHLTVIGKDNHIDWFKNYAVRLGLKDKVRFFGPLNHITPFYQFADALVIPSFYDPFANVTIEALAMGLCVVSSKHNGGHEVLTDENGVIIENLMHLDSVVAALCECLSRKLIPSQIRNSVRDLDFSKQLDLLMKVCE